MDPGDGLVLVAHPPAAGTLAGRIELRLDSTEVGVVTAGPCASCRTASPRLRAVLATREAWAHAQVGDAPAFRRSVRLAEDYFSEGPRDGDAATPSVRSLDEAELMGIIGARYRDLSRHDVRHAGQAQDYIGRAIALRDPDRVRNRVFDLVGLARAHLITREPERATELIGVALPDAAPWTSGRGRGQASGLPS